MTGTLAPTRSVGNPLLTLLGLPTENSDVLSLRIEANGSNIPTAQITRALWDGREAWDIVEQAYDLVPRDHAASVLPPAPQKLTQLYFEGPDFRVVRVEGIGYALHLQSPLEVDPQHPDDRPGIWYGSEYRTDQRGNTWNRQLGDYVMDDFGMLVEVPQ